MYNLHGLRSGYPRLLHGEPVQPLKYRLDVVLTQQLPCKLLCGKLNPGLCVIE